MKNTFNLIRINRHPIIFAASVILFIMFVAVPAGAREKPANGFSRMLTATQVENDSVVVQITKSPTGAMIRSLIIPGLGQWYNEKKLKALLVLGVESGIVINSIVQNQWVQESVTQLERDYYINNRNLSNWALVVAILVSMLDAYVDAHLFDFDESTDLSAYQVIDNKNILASQSYNFVTFTVHF